MRKFEFIALCEKHTIAPSIALENEDVRNALHLRDDRRVEELLKSEF